MDFTELPWPLVGSNAILSAISSFRYYPVGGMQVALLWLQLLPVWVLQNFRIEVLDHEEQENNQRNGSCESQPIVPVGCQQITHSRSKHHGEYANAIHTSVVSTSVLPAAPIHHQ